MLDDTTHGFDDCCSELYEIECKIRINNRLQTRLSLVLQVLIVAFVIAFFFGAKAYLQHSEFLKYSGHIASLYSTLIEPKAEVITNE